MSVAENVAIARCELLSDPFCCTSNNQQNSIQFLFKRQLSASKIHWNSICCAKWHYLSSITDFQLWHSHGNQEIQNIKEHALSFL